MSKKSEDTTLIPQGLQSSKKFLEDLKFFLGLSADTLSTIARVGNDADGFFPSQKAPLISKETKLAPQEARQALSIADYLYDRVTELRMSVSSARNELVEMCSRLQINLSDDQSRALEEILAYRKQYELGRHARNRATSIGPHFLSMDGSWSISVYKTRENDPVKVATLSLSISWHDGQGNHKETFLTMSEKNWEKFKEKVEEINKKHEDLRDFLSK